jgi:hypothetical protein
MATTIMNFMTTLSSLPKFAGIAAALFTTLVAVPKSQAVSVFFGSTAGGAAQFDATVTGAGNTVITDTWTTLPSGQTTIDRGDYSVSKINGSTLTPTNYGTLNGRVIDIDPSSRNVQTSRSSGIQFSFDNPVNALGFEVGDWGTCCQPSALYISFDNGAPIQVGLSSTFGDVRFNNVFEVFVGAIDDTNTFSTVQFWGDGQGEILEAGGRIRYANVAIGSISKDVPEPFTIIGTLIGGTAALRMRKKLKSATKA